ncbi:MAG: choice-of-anchor D domain-containing protein [Candidatus Binataceae bacterium]
MWIAVIPASLTVSPKILKFGRVTIGETSAPKGVVVSYPRRKGENVQVSIEAVSATAGFQYDAGASSCRSGTILSPGGKCKIAVTFTPSQPGQQTGSLNIYDNASNSPQSVGLVGSGKSRPLQNQSSAP